MKMHFSDLFTETNGAISPKFPVQIGGLSMTPRVSFGGGASFSGVNLAEHKGKWLEVEVRGKVYVIEGVYK